MLQALIGPVTGLLDKFIPDADQKAKLAHDIATMSEKHAQELALAQIDVLKEDAKGNWFQSSWRPLIGWISGLSLGINYMVAPICAGFGIMIPQADMSVMMPLMFGMLGIGGMRSYDKMKKTDTKKMTRIHLELFKFFNKIGNYFYRKHVEGIKRSVRR